jgi:hypothetical protein
VKHYWIQNDIAVDHDTIETMANNGESGDAKVELCRGERIDGKGPEYWLETNGGPRVITLDETDWSCSIEQAADAIGKSVDDVRALIERHVWQ